MDKRHSSSSSTEKIVHRTPNMDISIKELKNIQVSYKQKVPNKTEIKEIDYSLDRLEDIKIYRNQGEGIRPIFDRSDIIVNKEEPEDKTVQICKETRCSPKTSKSSSSYSPQKESNRQSSSRRTVCFSSRNRSRSIERRSRRSRSRSRNSRRYSERRRSSRSPYRDRRSRSPRQRYIRHSSRRSRSRGSSVASSNPATVIPVMFPHFYGPDEAVWFSSPLRPPMFVPPGVPLTPRGIFRGPVPGIRPPMQGRPPYMLPRQQFRQIRPSSSSTQ